MDLSNCRAAVLAEDMYQELELWYPYYRLREAGARVDLLGTGHGTYRSKLGYEVAVDQGAADAWAEDYDAVVIPGGYAPDKMRRNADLVDFVRAMAMDGRLVAFICHAGWVAVSAGILQGRRVTSFPAIKDDMVNAGAHWVDEPVVRDGPILSSRVPADLPAFSAALVQALSER